MEELRSVKLKRSDSFGFGFSVFGGSAQGLPPVIYDVADNSPAAFSGQLEAGDVIVKVNDTKVDSFTTKEVLKCLRLANDVVTLQVKKDPVIQERVKRQILAASGSSSSDSQQRQKSDSPPLSSPPGTTQNGDSNGSSKPDSPVSLGPPSAVARKCEKFIMTGDVIITTARSTVMPRVQSSPASPSDQAVDPQRGTKREASSLQSPVAEKKGSFSCHVRTSRSDDHLGKTRGVAAVSIDIDDDDDMASSLNTLLDTKQDDRKNLWNDSDETTTSSSGKRHAEDTVSELECCTSEMASAFGSEEADRVHASELDLSSPNLGDDDDNGFSKEEEDWLAEPDLSESHLRHPILDGHRTRRMQHSRSNGSSRTDASETLDSPPSGGTLEEEEEEEEEQQQQQQDEIQRQNGGLPPAEECEHQQNDEESDDAESLHSFHYSPKAVDMPSASRLAKRLYNLEGFKKSDVSRHLSKNNDFARVVAEEYLHFFNFSGQTLDIALRMFLQRFCLIGETQERERVLVHFSKRYLDSNPGSFRSQDAVHTLTCALMLLNTDLHGENVSRKMTCQEFIDNLVGLNEGENFQKDVLKALYTSIKTTPLEWPADDSEPEGGPSQQESLPPEGAAAIGHNPFLEVPNPNCATEYKKGYVMRKCCIDPGGKRTPLGKRSWKMFCATLRDLVLYLHKPMKAVQLQFLSEDEQGFRKNQLYESLHNSIRIHHSLAVRAADYTKKQHVFRLQTADQAEYLFQTGDAKELQSWIDTLNFVTASLSAPPLASAVGSQRRFQRPLLPVSQTKLNLREQLQDHENRIVQLEKDLEEHVAHAPEKGSKSRLVGDFIEKETFLQYELKRYRTYAYLLRSKMAQYPELVPPLVETSIGEVEEPTDSGAAPPCGSPRTTKPVCRSPQGGGSPVRSKRNPVERFSYKAAVFNKDADCG